MNCIASGCMNWLQKNPSVSCHRLPKDPQRLKKWIHVLKRKEVPARASRVCRQHFVETDFAMKGTFDAANGSFRMERSHSSLVTIATPTRSMRSSRRLWCRGYRPTILNIADFGVQQKPE
ncbi:hypothetical protein J4Q44_G00253290 [Coregonus suidteri]|uniref:THAP domain-containing protein 1 n=1 Tax=Coregonus suidteri TaxID=861788 RepID=A0AAN8QNU2_9TELE